MNYETSAFRHFKNERAKLRNSMADLRFLAFKCCQYYGIPATKQDALEVLEMWRQKGTGATTLPDVLNRVAAWRDIITQARPEDAEGVFRQTGQFITKIYEQVR
jgi:hypothetical protein